MNCWPFRRNKTTEKPTGRLASTHIIFGDPEFGAKLRRVIDQEMLDARPFSLVMLGCDLADPQQQGWTEDIMAAFRDYYRSLGGGDLAFATHELKNGERGFVLDVQPADWPGEDV